MHMHKDTELTLLLFSHNRSRSLTDANKQIALRSLAFHELFVYILLLQLLPIVSIAYHIWIFFFSLLMPSHQVCRHFGIGRG